MSLATPCEVTVLGRPLSATETKLLASAWRASLLERIRSDGYYSKWPSAPYLVVKDANGAEVPGFSNPADSEEMCSMCGSRYGVIQCFVVSPSVSPGFGDPPGEIIPRVLIGNREAPVSKAPVCSMCRTSERHRLRTDRQWTTEEVAALADSLFDKPNQVYFEPEWWMSSAML